MQLRLKCYLAGPDVFLPDAIEIGRVKKRLCAEYGFEGLYPFDNEVPAHTRGERIDAIIYRANMAMIRSADFGIANLTPFRGPSADVGTVFELGVLVGHGKPVFAYSNDTDTLLERVRKAADATFDDDRKAWCDGFGMAIEDHGNADNLMIDMALAEQGHRLIRHPAKAGERYRDLNGFEACLQLAAESLSIVRSPATVSFPGGAG